MVADAPTGSAGELLLRLIEQLREAGEDEIYLSPDSVRVLREATGGRAAAGPASREPTSAPSVRDGSGAAGPRPPAAKGGRAEGGPASRTAASGAPRRGKRDTGGERPRGTRKAARGERPTRIAPEGAPDAAPDTADLPEPEIVDVQLAIATAQATRDMFASSSSLDDAKSLEAVEKAALSCEKCELAQGRNNVVFGVGNPNASLMFIGEAPGRDEDLQGIPFVGRAGQLLDKILAAAGIERDDVYIGNIIKCRPPNNRTPLTSEIDACMPYLAKQIEHIRPRIICTLGLPATQTLLGIRGSMASLRAKVYRHGDILIIPTYHPAAALRDPRYKKPIWEDFQTLKREYTRAA
jgi:DNA polymerase